MPDPDPTPPEQPPVEPANQPLPVGYIHFPGAYNPPAEPVPQQVTDGE